MLTKELALLVKEKRIIRPVGGCGKDEHTYFPYDERRGKREHFVFPEGSSRDGTWLVKAAFRDRIGSQFSFASKKPSLKRSPEYSGKQ